MKRKIILILLLAVVGADVFAQTNLAQSKTAVASTELSAASLAVDGNTGTRWESAHASDPQWIYVDLGATYDIGSVTLYWEGAYGSAYTIDVSDDASSWTTVFTETTGNGGTDDIDLTSAGASGRYVRMHGTTRATVYGYSLWEFEVYEMPATGTVATLSDLKIDGTTVSGFSASDTSYTYSDLTSGDPVPTVTATTTDAGASAVVTDAASIPGTTTVEVTSANGSVTKTYYVKFAYGIPVAAPAEPTRDTVNVISVYSDKYSSIYTNLDPEWGQSTIATEVDFSGNSVLKYEGLNYQGLEYPNPTDVSGMDSVHFDYYTGDATQLDFFLIAGGENAYDVDTELGITIGEWVGVDIPLSYYEDAGRDLSQAFQFKTVGNGTVYLDNIYFYREPVSSESDSTVSNITLDGSQIPGFLTSKNQYTIEVELTETTVPTVVVTPNDENATVSYTNATKIPGTTTAVVTAQNGTSENTITIGFRYPSVSTGKTATSSSGVASVAVDGDNNSRWESAHGVDPQWLYVDLEAKYNIYEVTLSWEAAYATKYSIDVSDNAVDWTTVYTDTSGNGGIDVIDLSGDDVTGRYIRMNGTERATTYGYSLWEFDVYLDGGESKTEITGDSGWRLLSLPVKHATISQVADDTPVQGISGGADTLSDANVFVYGNTGAFAEPASVTSEYGDGLGFALYFFDNATNGSEELPDTLITLGSEPETDVDVALYSGASGQYTLVGNPFSSNFDASSITATGGSIQNTIAFWNNAAGTYTDQDRTSFIVAPWQGFWVETSDVSVTGITLPTSGKTGSAATNQYFGKAVNNKADIRFTLSSESTYDEAIRLAFREHATFDYDADDFGKLTPLIPEYATMAFHSNDMLKSVESLPYAIDEEVTVKLQPQLAGVNGTFTFAWGEFENIPSDWKLTLYDYETGKSVDMREESEYVFEIENEVQEKVNPMSILDGPVAMQMKQKSGNDRFGIVILPGGTSSIENDEVPAEYALEQNYPNPFNPSTTIQYSVAEPGQVSLSVYNLMGQKVAELVNETKAAGTYNIRWNAADKASGMYYYRLETNGHTMTRKMTLIK